MIITIVASLPNIAIPEQDKLWLESKAAAEGFASADEFAAQIVAQARADAWWDSLSTQGKEGIARTIDERWERSLAPDAEFLTGEVSRARLDRHIRHRRPEK